MLGEEYQGIARTGCRVFLRFESMLNAQVSSHLDRHQLGSTVVGGLFHARAARRSSKLSSGGWPRLSPQSSPTRGPARLSACYRYGLLRSGALQDEIAGGRLSRRRTWDRNEDKH
jgi:hypothetical protein